MSAQASSADPGKSDKAAPQPRSVSRWAWEWVKSIVVALCIWFVVRAMVVEAFRIPSSSMENTLLVGDFLFVNKALYGAEVPFIHTRLPKFRDPRLGDIVVFDSKTEQGVSVVKRVIGMPGDTLEMKNTVLYRNGKKTDEPFALWTNPEPTPEETPEMRQWQLDYLLPSVNKQTYEPDRRTWGPIVVAPDSYFVMGDNRDNSYDSRYWGFLDRRSIRGRPLFVYYSYDNSSWRALPFITAIRWSRIGHEPR